MTPPPTPRSSRFTAARSIAFGGILATALLLAACAQTPTQSDPDPDPDPQPTALAGIVQIPPPEDDDPEVLAVAASLLMLDVTFPAPPDGDDELILLERLQTSLERASVDLSTVAPSSVVETEEGAYLAGIALVESDGGFGLVLPDVDDIPEPLFRAAAKAIPLAIFIGGADCTLSASDPEARATVTFWQVLSSATPVFFTRYGLALGLNVTEPVDFESEGDLEGRTFVTLTYATAPTTLSNTGAECSSMGGTISVDVALEERWNQVTWSFSETTSTIGARPVEATVYSVPIAVGF